MQSALNPQGGIHGGDAASGFGGPPSTVAYRQAVPTHATAGHVHYGQIKPCMCLLAEEQEQELQAQDFDSHFAESRASSLTDWHITGSSKRVKSENIRVCFAKVRKPEWFLTFCAVAYSAPTSRSLCLAASVPMRSKGRWREKYICPEKRSRPGGKVRGAACTVLAGAHCVIET